MTFWDQAFASAVGAGAGASAAFLFSYFLERLKRREAHIVAGHVALVQLRSMLSDMQMVVEAWQHASETGGPLWWRFPAPVPLPTDERRVDLASLGFMLKRDYSALVCDVRDAENVYYDFMSRIEDYRVFFVARVRPAMFQIGIPEQLTRNDAIGWERKFPREITIELQDHVAMIELRVFNAPKFVSDVALDLRTALNSCFNGTRFDSPMPNGKLVRASLRSHG